MAIDNILIPPVTHYFGGMIGAAKLMHSEIKHKGIVSEDMPTRINGARETFLQHCEGLIQDPARYVKQPGYQLSPQDREVLQKALETARQIDWNDPQQIQELGDFVDSQCR